MGLYLAPDIFGSRPPSFLAGTVSVLKAFTAKCKSLEAKISGLGAIISKSTKSRLN